LLVLAGCDWAQLGFGPGHTDADPIDAPLSVAAGADLTTAWSTPCDCFAPIAAGGLVYVGDRQGGITPRDVILRALDASTGAQRWSVAFNRIGQANFLAIGNGLAYVQLIQSNESGPPTSDVLLAFDASTGALRWFLTPPPDNVSTVIRHTVLDGTRLFVETIAGGKSTVSAIDTTGHAVWSVQLPRVLDDMVGDGSTLYVSSNVSGAASYVRYAESNGAAGSPIALPVVSTAMEFANGLLYTGGFALHPTTGAPAWNAPGESVVAVTGSVALMGAGADLVGRAPVTGAFIWRAVGANRTAAGIYDPVIGGSLVLSGHPHVVNVLSLVDGTPLGATPGVGPDMDIVASGGRVFVDGSGTLYAFAPAP
jgi:hypothetical protein